MLNKSRSLRRFGLYRKAKSYLVRCISEKEFRGLNLRILTLFICVSIGTLVEFCVLHTLTQSKYPFAFTLIYLFVSACASPIQAGYSDNDRRKRVLVVASLACAFGFILGFFLQGSVTNLAAWTIIILVGFFGNIIETAWAAIGDERINQGNSRFIFAISNAFMAFAALIFSAARIVKLQFLSHLFHPYALSNKDFASSYLLYFLLSLGLSGLLWFKYEDKHDKDRIAPVVAKEGFSKLIRRVLCHLRELIVSKGFLCGIAVFTLWETAFYLIHQMGIDLPMTPFQSVTICMAIGYVFGTLALPFFSRAIEKRLVHIGHSISIVALAIGLVLAIFSDISAYLVVNACFTVFAFGAAFLSPSLFSSISANIEIHKQGVLFGSYGTADTVATAFAWIFGEILQKFIFYLYSIYKLHFISSLVMIVSCMILMIGAIYFYGKFKKIEPN